MLAGLNYYKNEYVFFLSISGVCAIDDLIYCIGGFNGQNVIKQCDCYDPSTDKWFSIAPLHTGNFSALQIYGSSIFKLKKNQLRQYE